MKKILLLSLLFVLLLIPSVSHAEEEQEAKEPVNLYLFMGATCHYCEGFLDWLETVDDDVKSKFNLVKLEVWKNAVNNSAMQKVADIFDDDSGSVPYIVIGDFSFIGFSESRDAQTIINAINDEYAKDTRNDVIKDNDITVQPTVDAVKEPEKTNPAVIIGIFTFIIIGGAALVFIANKKGL